MVGGVKKLVITKFIVIDIRKTNEIVILLTNAFFSPFFFAKNEIFNIIKP